jgi:hypothetical protein
MKQKALMIVVVLLTVLATTMTARADAPAEGTVVEGVSVPGITLGNTRAQVDAAYGQPRYCKDNKNYYDGALGLDGICNYDVEGINNSGEVVEVNFSAPDGSPAQASPDDVVSSIEWSTVVNGWVTTAGVNTTLAVNDPQAVIDAYPNAEITYWYGDFVAEVRDPELGILIGRSQDFYSGSISVRMAIFTPYTPTPPPPPPEMIRVDEIQMTGDRHSVTARVLVLDDQDQPVEGVLVEATWTYPNYDTSSVSAETASDGFATFRVDQARRGNYYIYINNVFLEGYVYDHIYSTKIAAYTKRK